MSRVLLTGASGFVGRRVLRSLIDGRHEVHATSRSGEPDHDSPEGAEQTMTWHAVDLLEPGAPATLIEQARPDLLLHLAWYAKHGEFWTAPENAVWSATTLELLDAFANQGGQRAVIAGTCAEYDWNSVGPSGICDERTTALGPHTFYGISKHATRLVAERYAETVGIELAWGRLFFLYGPGEQAGRLVPSVATGLLEGRVVPTTSGEQVRDFMHVDDVARAFVALLDSGVTGPVNIASGSGVEVRRIVRLVAEAARRPDLVEIGALDARGDEPPALVADVRRLREEVGFTPATRLEDGLAETVEWWRRARLA